MELTNLSPPLLTLLNSPLQPGNFMYMDLVHLCSLANQKRTRALCHKSSETGDYRRVFLEKSFGRKHIHATDFDVQFQILAHSIP